MYTIYKTNRMYTRQAWNSEEVWLLDKLEENNLDDTGFRSRQFRIAFRKDEHSDEDEKIGLARIQEHNIENNRTVHEITSYHVESNDADVGALLIYELVKENEDADYVFTFVSDRNTDVFERVGFSEIDEDKLPANIHERMIDKSTQLETELTPLYMTRDELQEPDVEDTNIEGEQAKTNEEEIEEIRDELGYDEETTTKYST